MNKKDKVIEVSKLITPTYAQIVIDLFQDDLEDLLDNEEVTPDEIGSFSFRIENLIEVFNPEFEDDILLLKKLSATISHWWSDREFINKTLGIDPNK